MKSFLPTNCPLVKLQNNNEWHDFTQNLEIYNNLKTTIKEFDKLPLFDLNLKGNNEYRRAYVMLSLITHSYVWNDSVNSAIVVLPKKLAVPFYTVSKELGLPPVLTHAAVDLWNWRIIDSTKDLTVENMKLISSMTGSESESYFYLVMTEIEWRGGQVIEKLSNLPKFMQQNNNKQILDVLNELNQTLCDITKILSKMYPKCDPNVFYNSLRKYLNGWQATLNKHLIFEGVSCENIDNDIAKCVIHDGKETVSFSCKGGSAAQSSLIQFFDIVLNVKHDSPKTKLFLNEMLKYMPEKHRQFLQEYEKETNGWLLDKYIGEYGDDSLKEIYNNCVNNLVSFRKAHMGLVYRYITLMSTKANKQSIDINKNLSYIQQITTKAVNLFRGANNTPSKGTGGTNINEFLTACIDETRQKKIEL